MSATRDGGNVILHCNFEELTALRAAAARMLDGAGPGELSVAAPSEAIHDVEMLEHRLDGDLEVDSLAEQRGIARALRALHLDVRRRMEHEVLVAHPAAETAVAAYFEYAHILTVVERNRRLGEEMEALIQLMTGAPPDEATAGSFHFPE